MLTSAIDSSVSLVHSSVLLRIFFFKSDVFLVDDEFNLGWGSLIEENLYQVRRRRALNKGKKRLQREIRGIQWPECFYLCFPSSPTTIIIIKDHKMKKRNIRKKLINWSIRTGEGVEIHEGSEAMT